MLFNAILHACKLLHREMSDFLRRAAEKQEWGKLMVRRPLEVVWCLKRML